MSDQVEPMPGEMCSCGRPAVTVYMTEKFGRVGYCGLPGVSPLPGYPKPSAGAPSGGEA